MHLCYDSTNNMLRLALDEADDHRTTMKVREIDGVIDVGENGALIGIELLQVFPEELRLWAADPIAGDSIEIDDDGTAYIHLMEGMDIHVRSAPAVLMAEFSVADTIVALSIPRRGAGYEITYPSGNR